MRKVLKTVKKVLSFLTVEPVEEKKTEQKPLKLSNKVLLKELVDHFDQRTDELSVGKRLLYPMSFNILLYPDDYNLVKDSFPFVLPEVIACFYASIKKKRDESKVELNYAPPATYWFFQFSACQVKKSDGKEVFIKRGEVATTASLNTFDIRKVKENTRKEKNVRLSVKCQNTRIDDTNINMDALLGMDVLAEGSYIFNFDKSLNEDTSVITSAATKQGKGWATLRWPDKDGNFKVYDMTDNYIDISGNAEIRTTNNIVKIDSDKVSISHVQIKYDPVSQNFYLAAFAKTRLNSREVPLSIGTAPNWVILPKFKSKIFLNDAVSIDFNANSNIV